jgi:hypothetical protein
MVILNSFHVHFYLLTWHRSLSGRGVDLVLSIFFSPMHVANICVKFLAALGLFSTLKQQFKKLLTWYLVYVSQPKSCNASSCTVHFKSSLWCSLISLFSTCHKYSFLRTSSNDLDITCCISSFTWASSNNLYIVHYNYSWEWSSSSDLYVSHWTSSRIWASSSNLFFMHYNSSHTRSSSRALCASRRNWFY